MIVVEDVATDPARAMPSSGPGIVIKNCGSCPPKKKRVGGEALLRSDEFNIYIVIFSDAATAESWIADSAFPPGMTAYMLGS